MKLRPLRAGGGDARCQRCWNGRAFAQTVTTGSLAGKVAINRAVSCQARSVEAIHTPTGTKFTAVTDNGGRYAILNVRVGGPYTITVTMPAFKKEFGDVMVTLGDQVSTDFALELADDDGNRDGDR